MYQKSVSVIVSSVNSAIYVLPTETVKSAESLYKLPFSDADGFIVIPCLNFFTFSGTTVSICFPSIILTCVFEYFVNAASGYKPFAIALDYQYINISIKIRG